MSSASVPATGSVMAKGDELGLACPLAFNHVLEHPVGHPHVERCQQAREAQIRDPHDIGDAHAG